MYGSVPRWLEQAAIQLARPAHFRPQRIEALVWQCAWVLEVCVGIPWPKYLGQAGVIQATIDTGGLHEDVPIDLCLVGDWRLTPATLLKGVRKQIGQPKGRASVLSAGIAARHAAWRPH